MINEKITKLKQKLRKDIIEYYYNPNVPCTCEGLFADTHRESCKRRSERLSERWIEGECLKLEKSEEQEISQCKGCHCMTKVIDGVCGKCGFTERFRKLEVCECGHPITHHDSETGACMEHIHDKDVACSCQKFRKPEQDAPSDNDKIKKEIDKDYDAKTVKGETE